MRARRKLYWLLGGVVVFVWLIAAGITVLGARKEAQAGLDRLEAARSELTPKDLLRGKGEAVLREAQAHFVKAHDSASQWFVKPLEFIPILGAQFRSVDSLSGGAVAITKVGATSLHDARAIIDATEHPKGAARVELIRKLGGVAAAAHRDLKGVSLGPQRFLIGPLGRAQHKFAGKLNELRTTVGDMVDASAGLADFFQGPRRYLVVAANNSEMRVGSGAYLSLGELVVRNGSLKLGTMRSANDPNIVPKVTVSPAKYDADFGARFGVFNPTKDFRELSQSARFDAVAPLAIDMWNSRGGPPVDGVLVLDPVALQNLLRATGPVTVDGVQYSADNLLSEIFVDQYRALQNTTIDTTQIERRDKLSKIARAAIQQVDKGSWKTIELFDALRAATVGRHILGWSPNSVEEKGWRGAHVGGVFRADAMMMSIQNGAGNKLDQFLTADATVATTHNKNGNTDIVITTVLKNAIPLPIQQFPAYVIGPYVYNPTGEAGKYQGEFTVELPRLSRNNALLVAGREQGYAVSGRDGPDHRVVSTSISIKAGETLTITTKLSLPRGVHSMEILPTSRVLLPSLGRPATLYTYQAERWDDTKGHRVHW